MVPDMPDWVIYLGAGLILLAGAASFIGGMIWDRARGRRRCPKCWYDMTTQAALGRLVCPECGAAPKTIGRLLKTRRSRWMILAGLVLAFAGAAFSAGPSIRNGQWVRSAPTTVLLLFIPTINRNQHPVGAELSRRFEFEKNLYSDSPKPLNIWSWQKRLAANRCVAALEDDAPQTAHQFALSLLTVLGPAAEPAEDRLIELVRSPAPVDLWQVLHTIESIGPKGRRCAPVLIGLLEAADGTSDDWNLRTVIRALGHYGADSRAALPLLIRRLESSPRDSFVRHEGSVCIVETLGSIGPDAEPAIPALIQILSGDPTGPRAEAAIAIWRIASSREDCRNALIAALQDEEVMLRRTASDLIQEDPATLLAALDALTASLNDTNASRRVDAARSIMTLGRAALPALAEIRRALHDDNAAVRLFAVRALAEIGTPAAEALSDLDTLAHDPDPIVQAEANRARTLIASSRG